MNNIKLLILARKGKVAEPAVAEFLGLSDLSFLEDAGKGRFAAERAERRVKLAVNKAERRLADELVKGIQLPEGVRPRAVKSLQRKLKGFSGQSPVIVRTFMEQFMPGLNLAELLTPIASVFEREGKIVLPESYDDTPELQLLKFLFGKDKVFVEIHNTFVSLDRNCDGFDVNAFRMGEVTVEDVKDLIVLAGGHFDDELGEGLLRRVRISIQDDEILLNRKAARRTAVVSSVFGAQVLNSTQAALFILAVAEAMSSNNGEDTGFRNAVDSLMGGLLRHKDYAFSDAMQAHKRSSEFQSGIFGLGINGLQVVENVQRIAAIQSVLKAMPDTLVKGQAEIFFKAEDLAEVFGDEVAIASTDPTKFMKRLLMDMCEQLELVQGMDEGRVLYRGSASRGRMTKIKLAPMLLSIFAGGPGSVPNLNPIDVEDDFGTFAQRSPKSISGTCHNTTVEAVRDALPKIGDTLERDTIISDVPGLVRRRRVNSSHAGTVIDVVTESAGRGTVFWQLIVNRELNGVEAKARGHMKGVINYANVGIVTDVPTHHDVLKHDIVYQHGNGCNIVSTADGGKIMGKNNARFRVQIAVNTILMDNTQLFRVSGEDVIRQLVPADLIVETDKGLYVTYSEMADVNGAYDKLMKEFVTCYAHMFWVVRKVTKDQFQKLAKFYQVDMDAATAFDDNGVTGKSVITKVGDASFCGNQDLLLFTQYTDGRYAIGQHTTGFDVYDIVKVESIGIEDSVTTVPSMLEVAYSAHMLNMPATAKMLADGGMKYAESYLRLLQLLTVQTATGADGHVQHAILEGGRLVALEATGHKVIRINDEIGVHDLDAADLAPMVESEVEDWDDEIVIAVSTQNNPLFAIDKRMLMNYASGTEEAGLMSNVRDLLAAAVVRNVDSFKQFANVVYKQIFGVYESPNVRKKLHAGATAVSGKRCAVITDDPLSHRKLYIRKNGKIARRLCRVFSCRMEDLEGRMVIGYRAPMLLMVPLVIEFSKKVGRNQLGVTDLVASVDQGDFDGDPFYVVAVTCPLARKELEKYDPIGFSYEVHLFSNHESVPEHFVEANRWDETKTQFARATVRKLADVHKDMVASAHHQTVSLGTDGNRSHLAVIAATLTNGMECQKFSVEAANGMMWFVFEPQLAGYAAKWQAAHDLLNSESSSREGHRKAFVDYATGKLSLTAAMSNAWYDAFEGHRTYNAVSRSLKYLQVNAEGNYEINNVVGYGATEAEKSSLVINILAGAVKHLAQGKLTDLLLSIDMIDVVYKHESYNDDGSERTLVNMVDEDGEAVRMHMLDVVGSLADDGNPVAVRMQYFIDNVLPIVRYLEALKASNEDDDYID